MNRQKAKATQQAVTGNLPPLSVVHFLVWTALAALVLAERRLRVAFIQELPNDVWTAVEHVLAAMCDGAGLGGILLWITWRRRGLRFPTEPGQWLLVMQGAAFLGDTLLALAWLYWRARFGPSAARWNTFEYLFLTIPIVQFLIPAIWCRCSVAWRGFFWFAVAVQALQLLGVIHLQLASSPSVPMFHLRMVSAYAGCTALLAFTAAADWYRRRRFSWVHWAGVATISISLLSALWIWILEFSRS